MLSLETLLGFLVEVVKPSTKVGCPSSSRFEGDGLPLRRVCGLLGGVCEE